MRQLKIAKECQIPRYREGEGSAVTEVWQGCPQEEKWYPRQDSNLWHPT